MTARRPRAHARLTSTRTPARRVRAPTRCCATRPWSPAMALDLGADLFGRSFLTLRDYTADEIEHLLQLAARLKLEKREHREVRRLAGRSIALIFEKDSTRTRIGFEVAAYDQGAHVTYLGPTGSHVGKKESVKDTARVLGRVYDAIEFRGFHQTDVEALAQFTRRPRLQRPHRRGPPDPGPGRPADDPRARRAAAGRGRARVRRGRPREHGRRAADRRRDDGDGPPDRRAPTRSGRGRTS